MSVDPAIMSPAEYASWESRADVLYHFYAYHFFDQEPRHANTIDLVNLDDADVQFYNRIADQVRRFAGEPKLFKYLKNPPPFKLPLTGQGESGFALTAEIEKEISFIVDKTLVDELTTRQRLIAHVRVYNLTQEPRRRFFLVGLSSEDCEFLSTLVSKSVGPKSDNHIDGAFGATGATRRGPNTFAFATDGCLGALARTSVMKDPVAVLAEGFMISRSLHKALNAQQANGHPGPSVDTENGESTLENEVKTSLERFAYDKAHRA